MRHTPELNSARWRRSSYSNANGGDCLEVADGLSTVPVRDSENPDGPILTVPAPAWDVFVRSMKGW